MPHGCACFDGGTEFDAIAVVQSWAVVGVERHEALAFTDGDQIVGVTHRAEFAVDVLRLGLSARAGDLEGVISDA